MNNSQHQGNEQKFKIVFLVANFDHNMRTSTLIFYLTQFQQSKPNRGKTAICKIGRCRYKSCVTRHHNLILYYHLWYINALFPMYW